MSCSRRFLGNVLSSLRIVRVVALAVFALGIVCADAAAPVSVTSESVFRCTINPRSISKHGSTPVASEAFKWGGASWQLVLLPHTAHASAYLRLVDDERTHPLPRELSFRITATRANTVLASRTCKGHTFFLEPPPARSWGFEEFCREPLALFTEQADGTTSEDLQVDIELIHDKAVLSAPNGLINNGNTCYMNAMLQSLYHISGFREGLLAATGSQMRKESGLLPPSHALANTFLSLKGVSAQVRKAGPRSKAWRRRFTSMKPASTLALCRSLGVNVELQEDSQEFKGILFEALFGDDVQSLSEPARDALKAPFEGQLVNQIECPDVEFTKSWTEPFLELALDVRGAKGNIEQSLDRYFSSEVLDGDNAYRVPGFDTKQRALKSCRISQTPEVLHVQLKRFAYEKGGPYGYQMVKVADELLFKEELDLEKYTADSDSSASPAATASYMLHAVMIHSGDANFGHYYAFVRRNAGGAGDQWFKCDDLNVKEVTWEDVKAHGSGKMRRGGAWSTSAYLLQYVRKDSARALL